MVLQHQLHSGKGFLHFGTVFWGQKIIFCGSQTGVRTKGWRKGEEKFVFLGIFGKLHYLSSDHKRISRQIPASI